MSYMGELRMQVVHLITALEVAKAQIHAIQSSHRDDPVVQDISNKISENIDNTIQQAKYLGSLVL